MNKNIIDIIKEIKKAQIAKSLLIELKKEHSYQKKRLEELTNEIQEINNSNDVLSNFSIEYIFKHLIGKRNIELEIVKEHYLSLSLQFNETKRSLELLNYEIGILKSKSQNLTAHKKELRYQLLAIEEKMMDGYLSHYRKIVKELKVKIELACEMDEAIIQGVVVNKSLNKTLSYLDSLNAKIQGFKTNPKAYKNYRIDKLDKYKNCITHVQLEFLKFKKEYNDVHLKYFTNTVYSEKIANDFLEDIRRNLLTDIRGNRGHKHSIQIVSNLKSNIMSLTRSLRSDVRKIEKDILLLEKEEAELIANLK